MKPKQKKINRLLNLPAAELLRQQSEPAVFPIVVANCAARLAGEKLYRVLTDAELLSAVLDHSYRLFDYDLVMVFADVLVEAEAMGCQIHIPEDEPPVLLTPAGNHARIADPQRSERMPVILAAICKLRQLTADEVFILGSLKGPFSLASFLAGPEEFLALLVEAPEQADHFLRLATENQKHFARAIIQAGGIPFIGDPMASGSLISREHFARFALPCLRELVAEIHALGLWTGLHICGDTTTILDLLAASGAEILSIDDISMELVRNRLGPEQIIMGNVSTTLLADGTPAEVQSAAEKCLATALPKLILASACDVPPSTPPANIQTLIQTARRWQWS